MTKFHEYTGCIHGHSIYSDGSGTFPEIIDHAKEAQLDFLLMSDHMTLKGKENGYGGWYDSLYLHVGYEIQDPDDQHHYLAFGIEKVLPKNLEHQEYIKEVEKQNALGIAAHPFEERDVKSSLPGFPPISWTTLEYPEIKVIEVWNMMSHWMEETTLKNRYWNATHPRSFAKSPKKNLTQWWDGANMTRKVTGVGSVDVHAIKIKVFGIFPKAIFHYKVMFKSIRTYLLTDKPLSKDNKDIENDKIILDTIRQGRSYIANIKRGDASGFRFWVEKDGQKVQMGDEIIANNATIHVKLPLPAFCKVIRNGKVCHLEKKTTEFKLDVTHGIYRIEAKRKCRGWIYSNHIKIKDKILLCVE